MKYYPVQASTLGGYARADAIRTVYDTDFPTMHERGTIRAVDYVSDYLFGMPRYFGSRHSLELHSYSNMCDWSNDNPSLESMEYTPAWTRQPRRDNKFKF